MWLSIFMLSIQKSSCCFGSNSPYRGFGICHDTWKWKCPYERKCIEAWKLCDGWADCIRGKDEVIHSKIWINLIRKFDFILNLRYSLNVFI
jgi:hypothetical protein